MKPSLDKDHLSSPYACDEHFGRTEWRRWVVVILFAIAMAWVESAVVFYLRT